MDSLILDDLTVASFVEQTLKSEGRRRLELSLQAKNFAANNRWPVILLN